MGRWAGAAVAAAVALAALAFRLFRLAGVPPGLYVDEVLTARNALAWRLAPSPDWLGTTPLLHPGWVETSNLYLAWVSGVLWLWGDGLLATRMVSVLPSLAAVALLYALGREVGGARVGALAAFLAATSHWAARTGRTGWDQVLMVALQLAALALLAAATRRGRAPAGLVAGGLLGLAQHTYVASRLAALHAVAWQAWEAVRPAAGRGAAPRARRTALARLGLLVAALALAAAPLLLRSAGAGAAGGPRVGQLAVWQLTSPGEPWATLADNLAAHAAMFHLRGGAYARDALPGWPMFDPVGGVLLLAGLATVVRRGGWERRLLLSWPLFAVLGGVLSVSGEGPPYPYRVGSLPAWGCLVAALGGVALWDALAGSRRRLAAAVAAAALAAGVAANAWVLFVAGPAYPGQRLVYATTETRVGLWLRAHRGGRPALVHHDVLRPPAPPGAYPYAAANRRSFLRPVDSAAAIQLAAGVYRGNLARSLAPLRPAGDVDLVAAFPDDLPGPAVLVATAGGAAAVARRWPAARTTEVRHGDGTLLAVILEVDPGR